MEKLQNNNLNKNEFDSYVDSKYLEFKSLLEDNDITTEYLLKCIFNYNNEGLAKSIKAKKEINKALIKTKLKLKLIILSQTIFKTNIKKTFNVYNTCIELFESTNIYITAINNLIYSINIIINKKANNLNEDQILHLAALTCLIAQTYNSLQIIIDDEAKKITLNLKGISYTSNKKPNIDYQIAYIISKLNEIGIINEIKEIIMEHFGNNYFVLAMIP